jgi:predicted Zn-dependent peptidase
VAAGELAGLTRGAEAAELSRAKAQLKASMFMSRESALARSEVAASQVLLFGRVLAPGELAARIDAVQPSDIGRLTERIVGARRAAVAVLGPHPALKAAEAFQRALGA